MVVLNESSFLDIAGLLPLFCGSQLRDEIKSLLLALEHHILDSSSSDQSLEQNYRNLLLVFLFLLGQPLFQVVILGVLAIIISGDAHVMRRWWTNFDLVDKILLRVILLLKLVFLDLTFNGLLCLLQLGFMTNFTS